MVNPVPRTLAGRYEVGELIGRGGMAEVHIGHDNRLGRTVAIKILRSDLARDPSFQARFRREAQAAASLNHPAIVAVYDTGEDTFTEPSGAISHVPFIVMEYVEGHTVRDILRDGSAVPIEEAIEITAGVLSALEYSHHAGIVHRDIKPANVMLTPTGAVKVMDFGIARAVADSAATMTQTHSVIGTAQYLSPEQARGESVDTRSDLYSTGCLLYELLTGRPPFTGDSPVAVAYQHVRELAAPPSSIATDVPPVLDSITLKALAKDRSDRYSSASEFRAALEAAARGENPEATAAFPAGAPTTTDPDATQVINAASPATQAMPQYNAAAAGVGAAGTYAAANQSPATQAFPATQGFPAGQGFPGAPGQLSTTGNSAAPLPWQQDPNEPSLFDSEEDEPRSKKGLIWALVAVGAVLIAGIIYILLTNGGAKAPEEKAVPDFSGMSVSEAQAEVRRQGFAEPKVVQERNDTVAEGEFISSTPPAGTMAPLTTVITLTFSTGPDAVKVPDVKDMTQEQARKAIEDAKLKVGSIKQERGGEIEKDKVTRTEPAANDTVAAGTEVNIWLADGFVDIPDVTGELYADAEKTLKALGVEVKREEQPTEDLDAKDVDRVVEQKPGTGAVATGTTVTLTVSVEMVYEKVKIPSVAGKPLEEALNLMRSEAGLNNFDIRPQQDASVPVDRVISVIPGEGTEVTPDTKIIVYVSTGSGETPSPDPSETDETEGNG